MGKVKISKVRVDEVKLNEVRVGEVKMSKVRVGEVKLSEVGEDKLSNNQFMVYKSMIELAAILTCNFVISPTKKSRHLID